MSSFSRTLVLASLSHCIRHPNSPRFIKSFFCTSHYTTILPKLSSSSGRFYSCIHEAASLPIEDIQFNENKTKPFSKDMILEVPPDSCNDTVEKDLILEVPIDSCKDTVEEILTTKPGTSGGKEKSVVLKLMKMERNLEFVSAGKNRWFPYVDQFKANNGLILSSGEVLEALGPCIMDSRKERFRNAVQNRSYSVCLVVEGLSDFGNVSAAFRSADALGFQSVHVVACDSSKRYRDNRHVSMGAEKWLDIELWDSTRKCFEVLKSRGYRIATTHVGIDAVSIYDMDWSQPTAIVVGNESRGISDEALQMSDLHCSIPMNGMVDSFNVSVAAGILMHSAVCDRISSMGSHGDLTTEEKQILLAEFFLRHSQSTLSIVNEYAQRKIALPLTSSKL